MGELAGGDASQDLPAGDAISPRWAGVALRYPIAARYTRLRQLSQPVSLDIPVLDLSVEDHATNAAEVFWTLDEVGLVTEIVAVELLLAYARLLTSPRGSSLGAGTGDLIDRLSNLLAHLAPETLPDEAHAHVMALLTSLSGFGET